MLTRRGELVCREFVEVVTDYLEGALSRRDAARLEAHLRRCGVCTEYLAQMRRTALLAGRLTVEDVPAEGRERLLQVFRQWRAERAPG